MAELKYKLKIKYLLSSDEITPEELDVLSQTVEKRIDEFMKDKSLSQYMQYDLRNAADEFYCVEDVESFNDALDTLYDYCDYHSIWVE